MTRATANAIREALNGIGVSPGDIRDMGSVYLVHVYPTERTDTEIETALFNHIPLGVTLVIDRL